MEDISFEFFHHGCSLFFNSALSRPRPSSGAPLFHSPLLTDIPLPQKRGLVPVIQYTPPSASDDETITLTESGPIVAFFTDLYPSHLLPSIPSSPPDPSAAATTEAALKRFRMSFFVDTYFGKVNPLMFKLVGAEEGAAQDKIVDEILGLLKKEIEPLLPDPDAKGGKGPYFGGSDTITTVEVSHPQTRAPTTPRTYMHMKMSTSTLSLYQPITSHHTPF